MARPRNYDEGAVITAAMNVFWRKGYVATSMSDLYQATGLKPGNLYVTFQDKEHMFRKAFEAYAAQFRASLPQNARGLEAIRSWLDTQVRLATEDPERKGCLIVNTVAERSAHSAETQALAQARLNEIMDFFREALRDAVKMREIAVDTDIDRHVAALTGAVIAIMTMGRGAAAAETIQAIGHVAFHSLKPETKPVG
ncbi:TetR/AcrR family transcriptional regulator [Pararhizobium arenae]|uniref:TetR/AcrR family transcriptional regulator n=1 Tax=Pararhizobium arenae TaxID=1856850 RepID=UPI00094B430A|nr:TetR/AcrR family transcriptional regulator [Pararhizobium arenae]